MLFYEEDATFSTKKLKDSVFVQTEGSATTIMAFNELPYQTVEECERP